MVVTKEHQSCWPVLAFAFASPLSLFLEKPNATFSITHQIERMKEAKGREYEIKQHIVEIVAIFCKTRYAITKEEKD